MQKKIHSIIEVVTTSLVKLAVVTLAQILYFNIYLDLPVRLFQNIQFAILAFLISITMGYALRRLFNWL